MSDESVHDAGEKLPNDQVDITSSEDAPAEGGGPTEDPQVLALRAELASTKDSMLRALADLQNYRKRSAAEIERARNRAYSEVATKLVSVADNFARTLTAAEEGASREALIEGVRIVSKQIDELLEELRVERIRAVGTQFDPSLHEAITMEHHELPAGTVIGEVESGFTIGNELVRPSKVKVSKGPKA